MKKIEVCIYLLIGAFSFFCGIAHAGSVDDVVNGNMGQAEWTLTGNSQWVCDEGEELPAIHLSAGRSSTAAVSSFIAIPNGTTHIKVRGFIKTEGIDEYDVSYNAALFADFHDGRYLVRREMIGFAQGTTDWTKIERTVPIPAEHAKFIRLSFEFNKTLNGTACLREVQVDSTIPEKPDQPVVMNIKAVRRNDDCRIKFAGENNHFVLSNLYGDKLDPVIGFMIEATSDKSDLSTLRLSVRVLDHEDQVLWESTLRAMEGRNLVEINRKESQLPLDEYLLFEARAIDPQGQTLMTSQIPFGVLSQDGDLADLPVPNSVSSTRLDSPFGAYPCNWVIDQKLPGFSQKSLYTIRMSGANWMRGSSGWDQESKDSEIKDSSPPWISTRDRELIDKYNFSNVIMAGHSYPRWATTDDDNISKATGTNIADVDAFRAYVRWLCAREQEKGVKYIQFFNEPQFQDSQKVQTHMKVLAAGAEEVRKSFPGMKIVSAGYNSGIVPAETYLKAGAGELVDVIDIHNYPTSLEQMEEWMVEQSKLVEKYAPGRELWSTEIAPRWTMSFGDMEMADRLIKSYVIGMRHGFKKLFWFGWRPMIFYEWEASMVEEDDQVTPRPVWFAYRTMTRKLEGHKFVAEIHAGNDVRAFLFEGDQGPVIVAWRDNTNKEGIKLPILVDGKNCFTVTDYLGKVQEARLQQDSFFVTAPHPVFIEGPIASRIAASMDIKR